MAVFVFKKKLFMDQQSLHSLIQLQFSVFVQYLMNITRSPFTEAFLSLFSLFLFFFRNESNGENQLKHDQISSPLTQKV